MNWKGKVAVVTGASSGIGRSLAVKLMERGATCILAARNKARLEDFSRQLQQRSCAHLVCVTDVTKTADVDAMVRFAVGRFGRIDILVNCAGAGMYGKIAEAGLDEARHIFDLNFFAPAYAVQKVYPIMAQQKAGVVVNISSTAGFRSWPGNGFYCASKHALNALSESLLLEGARDGVKTLLVMAGTTNTDFIRNSLHVSVDTLKSPPLDMSPDEAALQILKALEQGKSRIVLTTKGKILYALNRLSPRILDRLFSGKA